MAEEQKPKLDLPWATLLPLIAVLAGIVAQYKPLVSSRPPAPGEKSVEAIAAQDVDARLWQDPLAVARKEREAHETENSIGPATHTQRHSLETLARVIEYEMERSPADRVLLLAVMLDAGPYVEQSESRLRSRRAVLQGLSQSGFAPVDGEHIAFLTWPFDKHSPEDRLLIPWEECRAMDNPHRVHPPDTGRVFVLWLPAADFNPTPLGRFAAFISDLVDRIRATYVEKHPQVLSDHGQQDVENIRDKIDIKLIGPTNSDGLQCMIQEVREPPPGETERDNVLDGVSIISPRATATDEELLYDLRLYDPSYGARRIVPNVSLSDKSAATDQKIELSSPRQLNTLQQETRLDRLFPATRNLSVEETIEQGIGSGSRGGLEFVRTIAQDDIVLTELIKELELRGVEVKKSAKKQENRDQIVILTEWDSAYGRLLGATFASLASGYSYKEMLEDEYRPSWIQFYTYLHGIDGRLPGEQSNIGEQKEKPKEQVPTQPKSEEATEGVDQSDYLRRLARELKKRDVSFQRRHTGRIRAIGLLGSDIYDKLMILRALRPEFPGVVFFTNNYDAHFERRADWGDAHNLVIASSFGSKLPGTWQSNAAPFRDSIQTSMYAGTLVATGKMDGTTALELAKPKVFEISRRGAYDLNSPERYWFRDWLFSRGVLSGLSLVAVALLIMFSWIRRSIVGDRMPGGGALREHVARLLTDTAFVLICGVPIVVLAVGLFAQTGEAAREPLAFFSGISIWPSEMLRLIASLLAVHFMIKAFFALRDNEREISEFFHFDPLPAHPLRWRDFRLSLTSWYKERPDWLGPEGQFTAEETWHSYLRRSEFLPRFIRVSTLFVIYLVFSLSVLVFFPRTFAPARGQTAFVFQATVATVSVYAMMMLSSYVVDALVLDSNFIRMFTRCRNRWRPKFLERSGGGQSLTKEEELELSTYSDISIVANRTEVTARLIWYPPVVLALILVARSSFFDNWTWPLAAILILALPAIGAAVLGAILLRNSAEKLRELAIYNLGLLRRSSYAVQAKREKYAESIAEIRDLKKGAFAPLSDQHFIHAILLPSGGLGLLAVALRLYEGF